MWGGVFADTRDGLPISGSLPGESHVSYALGSGAQGLTLAVIAADIIRDAYLGRPNRDAALFPFGREQRLQR